jgi:hypothetical protein
MPNATPADCRAGWQIYKSSGFTLPLAAINEALVLAGYGAVSQRMYQHYKGLANAGYDHYVSVNRFDIARAAMPFESGAAVGRYIYHQSEVGVKVTFVRRDEFFEAYGIAKEISEVGAMLHFDQQVAGAILRSKLSIGDPLLVAFLDPPASAPARVTEVDKTRAAEPTVEVEFTRLHSVLEFTGQTALPRGRYLVKASSPEEAQKTADVVGRRIYYLLEAIDASRAAVNAFLEDDEHGYYAEPTGLNSLQVESPLQIVFEVPDAVANVLRAAIPALLFYIAVQKARFSKSDADYREEEVNEKRIKNRILKFRADTLEILHQNLRTLIGNNPDGSLRAERIIERQVLPSLEKLASQGVTDIDLSHTDDSPAVQATLFNDSEAADDT